MRARYSRRDDLSQSACLDVDPELMFPAHELSANAPAVLEAKKVCQSCTRRFACLETAVENRIEHGVWGGLSEKEREALRKRRHRATRGQTEMLELFA